VKGQDRNLPACCIAAFNLSNDKNFDQFTDAVATLQPYANN
jgi:hypothetical protein